MSRLRIPADAGPQFRRKPGQDSGPCRATVPEDAGPGVLEPRPYLSHWYFPGVGGVYAEMPSGLRTDRNPCAGLNAEAQKRRARGKRFPVGASRGMERPSILRADRPILRYSARGDFGRPETP